MVVQLPSLKHHCHPCHQSSIVIIFIKIPTEGYISDFIACVMQRSGVDLPSLYTANFSMANFPAISRYWHRVLEL